MLMEQLKKQNIQESHQHEKLNQKHMYKIE